LILLESFFLGASPLIPLSQVTRGMIRKDRVAPTAQPTRDEEDTDCRSGHLGGRGFDGPVLGGSGPSGACEERVLQHAEGKQ
jgi:hypothetical protein